MFRNKGAVTALAVIDVALFLLSGIPRLKNATSGIDLVLGQIIWCGFLLGLLALIVVGVLAARRAVVRRSVTRHTTR